MTATTTRADGTAARRATDVPAAEPLHPLAALPGPALALVVAVAYALLARYVLWSEGPGGPGYWPAAGLALAALLLVPTRRWGWVLGAVAVAELVVDLTAGRPLDTSLWWTVGHVAGPLVGATLCGHLLDPRGGLLRLRGLLGFLACGVIAGPVAGASVTAAGLLTLGDHAFLEVWSTVATGDAVGVLVVTPVLLSLQQRSVPRSTPEVTGLALLLAALPLLLLRDWGVPLETALPFLATPLLTWAALRFGILGASLSVFWVAQVANVATATGYGPFAVDGLSAAHEVALLQLFLGVAAISALVVAALAHDLSDRDDVERSLRRQAHHDELTGLPNRAALGTALEAALTRRDTEGTTVVLLLCDLDDFKLINDGLGHEAGDEVLVEVARRLRRAVRDTDLVARLGGDEFAVLLEDPTEVTVEALTERLLTVVPEPVRLAAGHEVGVGMSIGVAEATPLQDAQALLRDADATLYRAKRRGRGRAERFDFGVRAEVLERLAIPQELRLALERDELFCLHQPEIHLATGTLFGFESLVRWRHPGRGMVGPDRFVPLAETTGLADALFATVVADALAAQHQWTTRLGFRPTVSVNLSPSQLGDPDLPATVAMALTQVGAPASALCLEVTESAIADGTTSLSTLARLHELGVKLAIDDFGTGWSSLARLSDFPWDLLKIDRSFISKLERGGKSEHLVRATIVMAHALGMRTVAEGVETEEQQQMLLEMSCDIVQGFRYARPLSVRDAIATVAPDGRWVGPGSSGPRAGRLPVPPRPVRR